MTCKLEKPETKQAGFTLLEMLVVLGIISVVTAGAVAALRPPSINLTLAQASRSIAASLRATHTRAISSGKEARLTIDLQERWYGPANAARRSSRILTPSISLVVTSALGNDTSNHEVDFVFFPDGSATGGMIKLNRNDVTKTITVDWLTGVVRIEADDR